MDRLRSLVRETRDPWVIGYVIQNLGKDMDPTSTYNSSINYLRQELTTLLFKMYWRPGEARREFAFGDGPTLIAKGKAVALEQERMLFKQAEVQDMMRKVLKQQIDQWLKEQAKLDQLCREFAQEDASGIIVRLKDEEPLNRYMAIHMAQHRWEKLDNFIVDLLDDPVPQVRQAAHQALIKLSRGNDMGPYVANPTTSQIRTAQKHWRAYVAMQAGD